MAPTDWLKHAFALDGSGPVQPNDVQRAVIERLSREVVRRRLTTPAALALEVCSPLNFVSAQALHFFQPLVASFTDFAWLGRVREVPRAARVGGLHPRAY